VRDAVYKLPVTGIFVSVRDNVTHNLVGWVMIDPYGKYSIRVSAGNYHILFWPVPGGPYLALQRLTGITLADGGTVVRDVYLQPGGRISGVVTSQHDNKPINGVTLHLWNQAIPEFSWWTTTAGDGSFTFPLLPGTYDMEIHPTQETNLLTTSITNIEVAVGKTTIRNVVLSTVEQPLTKIAETDIILELDTNEIVVIPVKVNRIKDSDGVTVNIPGGLGAYKAKVTTSPEGGIQVLAVRGTAYFPNVTFDPATGTFAASHAPALGQPNNTAVAKLVLRLTGSAEVSHTLTVTFQEIVAAETGIKVPAEKPISLTFLRGDANGDGRVNIVDAMFIAQKVVGIRGLDTVNAINAASVRHDGDGGDRVNIVDAMFIAQHVVGIRDKYFE
jgi:hypothetical protein